ncbi:MAG: YrbL family protein [Gammaproteobacteria bacterium]|nr:YrbL family protein [Gammaproteobacteria bacterium]
MSNTLIQLDGKEPFAIGGTRRCYLHPSDQSRCIKVLREDRTPEKRRQVATGLKKLRSVRHWDDQDKEISAYRDLMKRHGSELWRHVPQFFGVVETDMGVGIVTQVFRNFDSTLPLNLDQQVPHGIDYPLKEAIGAFKSWLRKELVLTRDLLPHNIIAVREDINRCRLVIVDGLGNSEWIPISSWSKAIARRKIERKIAKFEGRIHLLTSEVDACGS